MIRSFLVFVLIASSAAKSSEERAKDVKSAAEPEPEKMDVRKKAPKSAKVNLESLPQDLQKELRKIDFKSLGFTGVEPISILNAAPISLEAPSVSHVSAARVDHAPFSPQAHSSASNNPIAYNQPPPPPTQIGARNRNPLRGSRQRSGRFGGVALGGRGGRLSLGSGGLAGLNVLQRSPQRPQMFRNNPLRGLVGNRNQPKLQAQPRSRTPLSGLTRALAGVRGEGGVISRRNKKQQ